MKIWNYTVYMSWYVRSHDLSTVSDCVTTAKGRMDDLLLRMMRCELDDFEIVSKQPDHVIQTRSHDSKLLQYIK